MQHQIRLLKPISSLSHDPIRRPSRSLQSIPRPNVRSPSGILPFGAPILPTIGETIGEKREAILRIAAQHGATQIRLIGSVARGEDRPQSDVDLLVTWREGTSLLDQAALMLELESLLGRRVDIASDGWVKPSIRESIYRDAIAL